MSSSADAAEQVVRMSLNGIEIAAKISGKAAERLAVLLYAVLKDQKRTKGKIRLTNMLKSGKELKVFAVKDGELAQFSKAAKQYGVLYCVLKDRQNDTGSTDVMVRADDAGKINRIFERFNLATVDMASVKTEIEKTKAESELKDENKSGKSKKKEGEKEVPVRTNSEKEKADEFMDKVVKKNPTKEKSQNANPSSARNAKSSPSGHSSKDSNSKTASGNPSGRTKTRSCDAERRAGNRPSVRKEMDEIRKEQKNGKNSGQNRSRSNAQRSNRHKAPKKKQKRKERG